MVRGKNKLLRNVRHIVILSVLTLCMLFSRSVSVFADSAVMQPDYGSITVKVIVTDKGQSEPAGSARVHITDDADNARRDFVTGSEGIVTWEYAIVGHAYTVTVEYNGIKYKPQMQKLPAKERALYLEFSAAKSD